jgi:Flp pilus assembly protein TadD
MSRKTVFVPDDCAPLRRALALGLLPLAAVALLAAPLAAQEMTSREVVQPLPSSEIQRLNRALVNLAKNPRDLSALIEAGTASLAVDDYDAATGFFVRAADVAPNDLAVVKGLATVYLRSGRALEAVDQYAKAVSLGGSDGDLLADQALAFDLVGDQASAQAVYRQVLQSDPGNDEARRRLALSMAIAGNRSGFEDTLRPLLDRRDMAGFRVRAFGLAILGDQARASAIVEQVMPRDLSSRIIPYLEFMPRLTKPQQAAAANLGIFPRVADIGRDDPRLARFASESQADSRLEPSGPPLGTRGSSGSARGSTGASPSAPGVVPASARGSRRNSSRTASAAVRAPVVQPPAPEPSVSSLIGPEAPAPVPLQAAAAVVAAPPAAPPPAPPLRVADAFADLGGAGLPDPKAGTGAVDITTLAIPREVAARPEPKPAAREPAKPAQPSRIWVQLATGRDVNALRFDWRRFLRQGGDLLAGFQPHVTPWGEANRLLVGPLDNREKARELVIKLKEKGIDSFSYISPEGQEIQHLK